jgi:AMP-polyphosphate phosphotransferase
VSPSVAAARHQPDSPSRRAILRLREQLLDAQFQLDQSRNAGLLLLATGLPLAGRTEAIRHVVQWLNPKLLTVHAPVAAIGPWRPPCFRFADCVPPRGRVAVLYDGWYADLLAADAAGLLDRAGRREALASLRAFEAQLAHGGVRLLKLHFTASREVLKDRLRRYAEDPHQSWRVDATDASFVKHYRREIRRWQTQLAATDEPGARWTPVDGGAPRRAINSSARHLLRALRQAIAEPAPARIRRPAATRRHLVVESSPGPVARARAERTSLEALQGELALQSRRRAFQRRSLAIVLEGMDGAGKSTVVRRITEALDPRQYGVVPVGVPTDEERRYPYLHRFWKRLPPPGGITVFDRSWYGRVLVERVEGLARPSDWRRAYREIREFESDLVAGGVILMKFWLAVGRDEQLRRFRERAANPAKRFKLDTSDWAARRRWWDYQLAADQAIEATTVAAAPWVLVPADDKHYLRTAVMDAICVRLRAEIGPP